MIQTLVEVSRKRKRETSGIKGFALEANLDVLHPKYKKLRFFLVARTHKRYWPSIKRTCSMGALIFCYYCSLRGKVIFFLLLVRFSQVEPIRISLYLNNTQDDRTKLWIAIFRRVSLTFHCMRMFVRMVKEINKEEKELREREKDRRESRYCMCNHEISEGERALSRCDMNKWHYVVLFLFPFLSSSFSLFSFTPIIGDLLRDSWNETQRDRKNWFDACACKS